MERRTQGDTLNDVIASQFHISCIQEAAGALTSGQRQLYDARGIQSISSRDLVSMINAGGSGVKVIKKCHDDDSMHCDMIHRPSYYGDTETAQKKQCVWYLVADVVAFDGDLIPLDKGGQYMWRVCTVHVCNVHAKKPEAARRTLAYFVLLMLRDSVDIVTGDFNQSHHILGEVLTEVSKMFENALGEKVVWSIPGQQEEIQTVMFNWPVHSGPTFTGPIKQYEMMVKDMKTFDKYGAEDFGLKPADADSHSPSLFLIRKTPKLSHADSHQRSEEGKKRDAERRKKKRQDKKGVRHH